MNYQRWKAEYIKYKCAYLGCRLYFSWKKPQEALILDLVRQIETAPQWEIDAVLDDFLALLTVEPTIIANCGNLVLQIFSHCRCFIIGNFFRRNLVWEVIDSYDLRMIVEEKVKNFALNSV